MPVQRTQSGSLSSRRFHGIKESVVEVDALQAEPTLINNSLPDHDDDISAHTARPPPLTLADLECIRTLGSGTRGKVVLVRTTRSTHRFDAPDTKFALKIISKRSIRLKSCQSTVQHNEIITLAKLSYSGYIANFVSKFADELNLYLMLEYAPLGNLQVVLKLQTLTTAAACFYYSNVVCGLAFLEEHGIVHFDLKPSNILIGGDGYCVLSGFDCSRDVRALESAQMVKIETRGAPFYLAPESISANSQKVPNFRYSNKVDWWASGTILFQMMTGVNPFSTYNSKHTKDNILAHSEKQFSQMWEKCKLSYPGETIGPAVRNLVQGLLAPQASDRFGREEVMASEWLGLIDWKKMKCRTYVAPSIPDETVPFDIWHKHQLPEQSEVPGLKVVQPSLRVRHDDRFSRS